MVPQVAPQPRLGPTLFGSSPFGAGVMPVGLEALIDFAHSRRIESPRQVESRKQYQSDLEMIISGDDSRTTLMIKNIPNKYFSFPFGLKFRRNCSKRSIV